MFERYTERARRVLFFARYEASQLGSIVIESEHLLLGLLREGKGLTSRLFARRHLSQEKVRREIEGRSSPGERIPTSVEIPFSADAKAILQFASDEAGRFGHNYIGTEHLLLGILRAERSTACGILTGAGFRLQDVRDEIVQLLAEKGEADPGTREAPVRTAAHAAPAVPMVHTASAVPGAHVPAYLPSEVVHISLSAMRAPGIWLSETPRSWHISGADLRTLIARAYRSEDARVELPGELADGRRYDVVLLLPADEDAADIARRVQQAIEQQFRIAVSRQPRSGGEALVVSRPSPRADPSGPA